MAEYQAQKAFKCPDEQHQLMRFFRKVNNALPFEGNATEVFYGWLFHAVFIDERNQ